MSGMTCDHRPLIAQTVRLRWEWHANVALGQQTRLDNRAWHINIVLGLQTETDDVRCGMTS